MTNNSLSNSFTQGFVTPTRVSLPWAILFRPILGLINIFLAGIAGL